ncbi:MAG: SurA N-terminal domain-containing protein [Deltaproteobacteria bacterium]|nr:SurA N-terminal domain-containing protein [Deltaproteobacteria bacterium]
MVRPLFYLCLFIVVLSACGGTPDTTIASVNGEKIASTEFLARFQEETRALNSDLASHAEAQKLIKKKVLDTLIEEKLLLQEAKRLKITVSRDEIQKEIERLKSGYDQWEFHEALKRQRINEEQWIRRIKNNLLLSKLTKQVLTQQHPSEKEIAAEYQKNLSLYMESERSHCRQIVASSREKAEKILELLKKGENFAALAKEFSESPDREKGGDLGFVARGDLPPILDEACFRFLPGQTSGIVTSAYGFHIFRVIERKPPRTLSLKEARPQIEAEWREKNQKEILKKWLNELYKHSKIEIDEAALLETKKLS